MPVRGFGGLVSSWSFLIRGILAALRQKFHLSTCPNLAGHLSRVDGPSGDDPLFTQFAEVPMYGARSAFDRADGVGRASAIRTLTPANIGPLLLTNFGPPSGV
jgi:hypothetical protein